jgi:valyl-tRNA synthetase
VQVLIPLDGVVDLVALRSKLEKSLSKVSSEIDALTRRLSSIDFVDKAKPEVVQAARTALAEAEKQAVILGDRLSSLPPIT